MGAQAAGAGKGQDLTPTSMPRLPLRAKVAHNFKNEMELVILNVRYSPTITPFHLATEPGFFWGSA